MPQPISFRAPKPEDGFDVHQLVERCSPLDTNSTYCNMLQCSHFASTSVAAIMGGELVGFVSGYLIPSRPNTLFIWQVAVSSVARGRGLATQMIQHILEREGGKPINYLETTITEDNKASWALFEGVARHYKGNLRSSVLFDQEKHFRNTHDSETLVRIGPFVSVEHDLPIVALSSIV